METKSQTMFSLFKAAGQPESPVIRAIQYDGTNKESINRLCDNYIRQTGDNYLGHWIIENPKGNPRTFNVMPDLEFSQTYESFKDDGNLLSGTSCDSNDVGTMIVKARKEQIEKHGFTALYDRKHNSFGNLVTAGKSLMHRKKHNWPFKQHFLDKIIRKTRLEQLAIAGAMFMAENERTETNICNPDISHVMEMMKTEQAKYQK